MAAVLAKVQKEVGAEAKISSAQRVRVGGVMGFFQRERFEVLVEIPDTPVASLDPAPGPSSAPSPTPVAGPTELKMASAPFAGSSPPTSASSAPAGAPAPSPAAAPFASSKPPPAPAPTPANPFAPPVAEAPPNPFAPPAEPAPPNPFAPPVAEARPNPFAPPGEPAPAAPANPFTPPVAEAAPANPFAPRANRFAPPPAVEPPPTPANPFDPSPASEQLDPVDALLALAEQVNEAERPLRQVEPESPSPSVVTDLPPVPEISTESDSFAEVLSRIAFQSHMRSEPESPLDSAPAELMAENPGDDGLGEQANDDENEPPEVVEVVEAKTGDDVEVVEAKTGDDVEVVEVKTGDDVEVVEVKTGDDVEVDPTDEAEGETDEFDTRDDEAPEPEPGIDGIPASEGTPIAPQKSLVVPVIADRPTFLHQSDAPAATSPEEPVDAVAVPRTRITDSPLALLGLPVPYMPVVARDLKGSQLQKALVASLEQLPKPPVIRPSKGSIIAVVGDSDEAMELAEDLANKWGRPREEIVLASQHFRGKGTSVVRTVRIAEDSRRSWSRRSHPTIVAVEARMGSEGTVWAEHILSALEPIATYGTVDATRKPEDVMAWAEALGGIDCLAVNYLDETVSPAAVLATGIPVERIDGRKATPAFWAMLLAERLSAV